MPTMANITVKKNDGVTDAIFTALTPSAGDKVPAQWRDNSVSTIPQHRPTYKMVAQNNAANTVRRTTEDFLYPVTATENGVVVLKGYHRITVVSQLLQGVDEASINEAVSQSANLQVSALRKDSVKSGYAPT